MTLNNNNPISPNGPSYARSGNTQDTQTQEYDYFSSHKNHLKQFNDSVESNVYHTDSSEQSESLSPYFQLTLYDS